MIGSVLRRNSKQKILKVASKNDSIFMKLKNKTKINSTFRSWLQIRWIIANDWYSSWSWYGFKEIFIRRRWWGIIYWWCWWWIFHGRSWVPCLENLIVNFQEYFFWWFYFIDNFQRKTHYLSWNSVWAFRF